MVGDLRVDNDAAVDLVAWQLQEATLAIFQHRALARMIDSHPEVWDDNRQKSLVVAGGMEVVAQRVTSSSAMGVQLSQELLVPIAESSHQPSGFRWADYHPVTLSSMAESVQARNKKLLAGRDSGKEHERFRSGSPVFGPQMPVDAHGVQREVPYVCGEPYPVSGSWI